MSNPHIPPSHAKPIIGAHRPWQPQAGRDMLRIRDTIEDAFLEKVDDGVFANNAVPFKWTRGVLSQAPTQNRQTTSKVKAVVHKTLFPAAPETLNLSRGHK